MPSYRFARAAQQDLRDIIAYTVKQWDKMQATKYVDGLENLAGQLAERPKLGKPRPDLFDDFAYLFLRKTCPLLF